MLRRCLVAALVALLALVGPGSAPVLAKTAQPDVLWHNPTTGELSAWEMNGDGVVLNSQSLSWRCDTASGCASAWKVVASANGLTWHNATTGQLSTWLMGDLYTGTVKSARELSWRCDSASGCASAWKVVGQLDVNHDWVRDLLWHNASTGELSAWLLRDDGVVIGTRSLSRRCDTASGCASTWKVVGTGDFNSDGNEDVLWHNATSGDLTSWSLNGAGTVLGTLTLSQRCGAGTGPTVFGCSRMWHVIGTEDFNHDGIHDVLWHSLLTGQVKAWHLDGHGVVTGTKVFSWTCDSSCSANWQPVGVGNFAD